MSDRRYPSNWPRRRRGEEKNGLEEEYDTDADGLGITGADDMERARLQSDSEEMGASCIGLGSDVDARLQRRRGRGIPETWEVGPV